MEADTIVAVSTSPGVGAIGVVRVSGPQSLSIARRLAVGVDMWTPRHAVHAALAAPSGATIDDALVSYFAGPHSYTGEDMVELSCHGNPLILDRVVSEIMALGARPARPGEFTLRAFLSGRLDLTQAEAVVDLVEARTEAGAGLALSQLEGALARRVEPVRERLLDLVAHLTAVVDFAEEDVPAVGPPELAQIDDARSEVERLLRGAHEGQVLRHGVSLAIAGPPNAGKSSILNRLLGRDRAIVTAIPGTTRDTLEEELVVDGILFHIVDTAGIVESSDTVEAAGIARSRSALETADIGLIVVDGSTRPAADEEDMLAELVGSLRGRACILALNKSDLPAALSESELRGFTALGNGNTSPAPEVDIIHTSAIDTDGLGTLRAILPRLALGGTPTDGFVVSNARHVEALRQAREALSRASTAAAGDVPLDLVNMDLREALDRLGEILGIGVGDEILDRVFSRFCIGK